MLFLILTETWLRNHLDAEISVPNYSLFRADRTRPKKRRGRNSGGVAVYMRDDLAASSEVLLQHSDGVIELLCLNVKRLNLILCSIYRPPDDPSGGNRSTSRELHLALSKLADILDTLPTPTPDIIIAGDFNVPRVAWPSCIPCPGAGPDDREMISLLSNLSFDYFLEQQVVNPTHKAGNVLDLIFSNNPDSILSHDIAPTAPVSSHHLIRCTTTLLSPCQTVLEVPDSLTGFSVLNLMSNKTNWENINLCLQLQNWDDHFADLSPSDMLEKFISICEDVATQNSPKRRRQKTNHPVVPRHRKILMRKRTKLRKKFYRESNQQRRHALQEKLTEIERKLQSSYNTQLEHDEQKAVEAIYANPKYFYSYARDRYKVKSQVGPLLDTAGNYISDPAEIASTLSEQYKGAFSTPTRFPLDLSAPPTKTLQDFYFDENHIIAAISEVGIHSAPGPDRFPAVLLRKCKEALARPLNLIWRTSLDTGDIPELLKMSVITPIYKGGDKQQAKNYRPVALTSHLIKSSKKLLGHT